MTQQIIDLNSGKLTDNPEPVETVEAEKTAEERADDLPVSSPDGMVIDLDNGGLVEAKPAPTVDDFIMQDMPAEALQELDPIEASELPEIGYLENKLALSGENGKAFRLALGNLVSSDPIQQMEIIQQTLPDARVTTLANGRTVVDYQGEKFVMNAPGLSAADVTRFAGQFLAFLPAGRVATMGRAGVAKAGTIQALRPIAASASAQRLGQVAAGAAASAATSAGLDVGAAALGDGVQQGDISGERAVLAGIFGGGAELLGPAFRAITRKFRGTPDDLKYIDLEGVKELRQAADETGIRIFEPQATQARADSAYMRILQDLPETQQEMMSLLHRQNEDASSAVMNYLAKLSDDKAIVEAPKRVRDAAVNALDDMVEARSNLVRQGYEEAFAAGTQVPVQPTVDLIDNLLSKTASDASNPVFRELNRYKNIITADATEEGFNDLQRLDGIKKLLDDAIEGYGESSVDKSVKGALQEVRATLRGEMERASPAYDAVKELYSDASGPIESLRATLVGKVAGITDENLKRVIPTIFDAQQSNPTVLRNARQVIEAKDPEAWQMMTRAYLEGQLGKISTRAIEGVPNLPAAYGRALFGSNRVQRRMILDALPAEQQENAKWMELALAAAARGRSTGSDTAAKTEAIRSIREGGLEQYINPLTWAKGLSEAAKQARFERRASNFVRLMTDDNWSAEMSKLRELDPSDSATGRALLQALMRIEDDQFQDLDSGTPRRQPSINLNEAAQ